MQIPKISPIDKSVWQNAQSRFDRLIKPVGSLARLEEITCLYAAARKTGEITEPGKALLVFLSDHGAAADDREEKNATAAFRESILAGKHALNVLANTVGASIVEVFPGGEGTKRSGDIRRRPALSESDFTAAFQAGRAAAQSAGAAGAGVIGLGHYGGGAALSQAALMSMFFGERFAQTLALDERELLAQVFSFHGALDKNDLPGLVRRLGGWEMPAMIGSILQAASMGMPVFLDGLATFVAAFVAAGLRPPVGDYLIAVSSLEDAGQNILLTQLGLSIMLDLKLHSPAGEASLLGFQILSAGIKAFNEMDSFGRDTVHHPLGDI
ncbi:MAG: nicotinate-nucleotide--dimethylbenzimidazole phosphoribosyltransferase [Acidaminococcales bacterium]|jgi:nicotinate-nucleotide--dimethylbenzimidazole phosphoribosyltransferase|nr:nicotinate-nucleotide--dimethylbenzimidazole phosphoribosyltransferase [Acidaminococcales bacterium]